MNERKTAEKLGRIYMHLAVPPSEWELPGRKRLMAALADDMEKALLAAKEEARNEERERCWAIADNYDCYESGIRLDGYVAEDTPVDRTARKIAAEIRGLK